MSKGSGHKVENYDAKKDIVICVCGFSGTVAEYDKHRSGKKGHNGTMNFLKDISKARWDYPKQGHVTGTARGYGK